MVLGAELYAEYAHGKERPTTIDRTDLAESHRRKLAELMPRGARQLGTDLQLGINAFLDATKGRTAEDLLPWHQGRLPCGTLTSLLIGEQLLHGYDIAQALGVDWPIEGEPARLTLEAVLPLLPDLVDSEAAKGVEAVYELAIDGGPRVMARFRDGAGSIGLAEGAVVDCQLSGGPVAWLLALYGRVAWEHLLQTGKVTVTAGDAALGAGFKRLFRNP
jgi:hypothetical protein